MLSGILGSQKAAGHNIKQHNFVHPGDADTCRRPYVSSLRSIRMQAVFDQWLETLFKDQPSIGGGSTTDRGDSPA
jgi:hypothetical protein